MKVLVYARQLLPFADVTARHVRSPSQIWEILTAWAAHATIAFSLCVALSPRQMGRTGGGPLAGGSAISLQPSFMITTELEPLWATQARPALAAVVRQSFLTPLWVDRETDAINCGKHLSSQGPRLSEGLEPH